MCPHEDLARIGVLMASPENPGLHGSMARRRGGRVLAAALLATVLFPMAAALGQTTRLSADELLRQIASEGSRAVLQRLWTNEAQLEQVCSSIESGDPSWLEVARHLRASSDAAASLSLNYAVARALPSNPAGVLELINHGFTVKDICTSPFIEPEPGVAEAYRHRAAAALRGLVPTDLESVRAECLKRIEKPWPDLTPG